MKSRYKMFSIDHSKRMLPTYWRIVFDEGYVFGKTQKLEWKSFAIYTPLFYLEICRNARCPTMDAIESGVKLSLLPNFHPYKESSPKEGDYLYRHRFQWVKITSMYELIDCLNH